MTKPTDPVKIYSTEGVYLFDATIGGDSDANPHLGDTPSQSEELYAQIADDVAEGHTVGEAEYLGRRYIWELA